jgi:hypothetical protein
MWLMLLKAGLILLKALPQLFAATVQMGPDGADGHAQGVSDLLVAALLLMIEDEDGSFDVAEALELLFDGLLELALLYLLLSVAVWVRETVLPAGGLVGERDMSVAVAAAALPLVLRDVDGDAVEIGGDESLAAKAGEGAVEAEEDVLSEIVEMLAAAGKAQEGAEDHVLMVAYHLLEGEIGSQAGLAPKARLDRSMRLKFHARRVKL